MMLILRDDQVIEIFDSPASPPGWIEAIDIENQGYSFCDESGQRYVGVIIRLGGWFGQDEYELQPEGVPDISNALTLVDKAKLIEPNDRFPDLKSLRDYLLTR